MARMTLTPAQMLALTPLQENPLMYLSDYIRATDEIDFTEVLSCQEAGLTELVFPLCGPQAIVTLTVAGIAALAESEG